MPGTLQLEALYPNFSEIDCQITSRLYIRVNSTEEGGFEFFANGLNLVRNSAPPRDLISCGIASFFAPPTSIDQTFKRLTLQDFGRSIEASLNADGLTLDVIYSPPPDDNLFSTDEGDIRGLFIPLNSFQQVEPSCIGVERGDCPLPATPGPIP